jgi:hypothetical protein
MMSFEKFPNNFDREPKIETQKASRRNFLRTAMGAAFATGVGIGYGDRKNHPKKESDQSTEEVVDFVDLPAQHREKIVDEQLKTEEVVEEVSSEREVVDYREFKKMRPELGYEENYVPEIENLNMPDKVGKYGAETHEGKILRTLRYKNITDAVEDRYNLPPGILMAMIIEESTGVDLLPNARGDGGFGLSHMQGATASEYGLKTFGGCNSMICGPKKTSDGKYAIVGCRDKSGNPANHGKGLADFMKENADNRSALVEADDRLHFILNIDAAGRMLAAGIGGPKISGLGSFRTAICRYSGKHNYEAYWKDIKRNMRDLESSEMMEKVSDLFNSVNPDLKIDGKPADFATYIKSCHKVNENYGSDDYEKMPKYRPDNSDMVLKSYVDFIKK